VQSAKKLRFEFQCVVVKAYDPLRLFEEVQPDEACGPLAWEEEAEPLPLPDPFAQPEPDFPFDQTVCW
jgi:hypothetical protein